jgi:hypothetical protein
MKRHKFILHTIIISLAISLLAVPVHALDYSHLAPSQGVISPTLGKIKYQGIFEQIEQAEIKGALDFSELEEELKMFFVYLSMAHNLSKNEALKIVTDRWKDKTYTKALEDEAKKHGVGIDDIGCRKNKFSPYVHLLRKENFGVTEEIKAFAEFLGITDNPEDGFHKFIDVFINACGADELKNLTREDQLKHMLALFIYESVSSGKVIGLKADNKALTLPEHIEMLLWSICKDMDLDLEEVKIIDIEAHIKGHKAQGYGREIADFDEGEISVFKIDNRTIVHLICSLLDEYFLGLRYSVSHVPRVLGWSGGQYYYEFMEGSEGFGCYYSEVSQDPYAQRGAYEFGKFPDFFLFSHDMADALDSRRDKNVIINKGNLKEYDPPYSESTPYPRTWKLIDFVSFTSDYSELLKFIAEEGESIRSALGESKYELLMIAIKRLTIVGSHGYRRYRFQKLFKLYQGNAIAEIFEEGKFNSIRVLVNGAGIIGKGIVDVLKAMGFDVYVFDSDAEKIKRCVQEYNCKCLNSLDELQKIEFSLIVDAAPAGAGKDNMDNIYRKLPYRPKILFQGGENRDIAQPYVYMSGQGKQVGDALRIENCNFSAMSILFEPLLWQFKGINITNYYQRSKDFGGKETEYQLYHHDEFRDVISALSPELAQNLNRFISYKKDGEIPGYHIHSANISCDNAILTVDKVKEIISKSSNSFRLMILDEELTGDISFTDMIKLLQERYNLSESPLLIVRVMEKDGHVVIEYAVPHRTNVIPDNVTAVCSMLGLEDSISFNKYLKNLSKKRVEMERYIYKCLIYLWTVRNIIESRCRRDLWQIAHIDYRGEIQLTPYINILSDIGDALEKEGWQLPKDKKQRVDAVRGILRKLFEKKNTLDKTIALLKKNISLAVFPYGPEEIREDKRKFIVSDNKHITEEQFLIICRNLAMIIDSLSEWARQNIPEEEIRNKLSNIGELVVENIEFTSHTVRFLLGGCADFIIDIQRGRLIKQKGLTYWPTSSYYSEVAKAKYEDEREGIDMDGEANMGLDCFLSWEGRLSGISDSLHEACSKIFQLKFKDQSLGDMNIMQGFDESPDSADNVDIAPEKYFQPEFLPSGDPCNIHAMLNRWYYAVTGANAFGAVNRRKTLDEEIAQASAKEFFSKLVELEQRGELPKQVVVYEWGAGDGFSMGIFLGKLKELSEEHKTLNFYDRILYVACDFSEKVLADIRSSVFYESHKDKIILRQINALSPPDDLPKALLVRANYLLNSLPKVIVQKEGDSYFELYRRGYLDMGEDETIKGEDGKTYTMTEVKGILEGNDNTSIAAVGKILFKYIKWAEKLMPITNLVYLKYLRSIIMQDGKRVSLDFGPMHCVNNMAGLLEQNGYIEICDAGALNKAEVVKITGKEMKYWGAVYSPVNFDFIGDMCDVEVKGMSQGEFVYNVHGAKVERLLLSSVYTVLEDFEKFKKYFRDNFSYHVNNPIGNPRKVLEVVADMVMKEYGYSEEGLKKFEEILRTANNQYYEFVLKRDQKFVPYRKTQSYIDDYFYSAYLDIMQQRSEILKKQMWLTSSEPDDIPYEERDLYRFQRLLMHWRLEEGVRYGIFKNLQDFTPGLVYVRINPKDTVSNMRYLLNKWLADIYSEVRDFTWIREIEDMLYTSMIEENDLISRDVLLKINKLREDKDIVASLINANDVKGKIVVSLSAIKDYTREQIAEILDKADRSKIVFYSDVSCADLESKASGFSVTRDLSSIDTDAVFLLNDNDMKVLGFDENKVGKKTFISEINSSIFVIPLDNKQELWKFMALGVVLINNNFEISQLSVTFQALLIAAIEEYLEEQGIPATRKKVDSILNTPGISLKVTQELDATQEERLQVLKSV